jgi:hypothetical protein
MGNIETIQKIEEDGTIGYIPVSQLKEGEKEEIIKKNNSILNPEITDEQRYREIRYAYLELVSGKDKRWNEASELLVNFICGEKDEI